jgi:membrane protein required for beta-lactamase induction
MSSLALAPSACSNFEASFIVLFWYGGVLGAVASFGYSLLVYEFMG